MATFSFFVPTDMSAPIDLSQATLSSASPSAAVFTDANNTYVFFGSFGLVGGQPAGTVTGFQFFQGNTLAAQATGLSVDVNTAVSLVANNQLQNLFQLALPGHDTINGSSGNDVLIGYSGNDVFTGGGGNDVIEGGGTNNTVVYSGTAAQYSIAVVGSTTTIADTLAGRDGTETLTDIQKFQFSDHNVNLLQTSPVTLVAPATDNHSTNLNAAHLVTVTLNLNEVVTVSGTPTLQLNDNEVAVYTSGSGSKVLTFSYVVQTGDSTSDLQVTGLNLPTGAAIADGSGNSIAFPVTGDLGIQVNAPATTSVQQEINGLYVTVFGVPATGPGLGYWIGEVIKHDPSVTMASVNANAPISTPDAQALSLEMVESAQQQINYFHAQYDSMTDSQFVAALYSNIGGTGITNAAALGYWLGRLQSLEQTLGVTDHAIAARASVSGEFVQALIASDVNLGAAYWGLSATDFAAAQADQQSFLNKVALSQYYAANTAITGPDSILNYTTESGPIWNAAQTVLAGVTTNPGTVSVAITGINNVISQHDLSLI